MNSLSKVDSVIQAYDSKLHVPGVVAVRPGYKLENGWPTQQPAVVVVLSAGASGAGLPSTIGGLPIDVRTATRIEQYRFEHPEMYAALEARQPEFRTEAFPQVVPPAPASAGPTAAPEAAKPQLPYIPPIGATLASVTGRIPITCHASPDAGWPTLRSFLSATKTSLTVGLYDFTSKHILDEVRRSLAGAKRFEMVLDNPARNPTADQSDVETIQAIQGDLGAAAQMEWALVRSNKAIPRWIFPTAYHIKVAVRDSESLWLSSGNWNNSNQPDMDPFGAPNEAADQKLARKSDRDWHVIIDHPALARTYEEFLEHDFDVAHSESGAAPAPLAMSVPLELPADFELESRAAWRFFPPLRIEDEEMTVTPLLTPDPGVYEAAMLGLIQSATSKLYVQLQYIHPSDKEEDRAFEALIDAVAGRLRAGVDVRIIVSQYQASNGWLERLQAAGIDLGVVRLQNGVHNKGFIIDSRTVALGSQNWSGDGVLRNRDASVIIESTTAAAYYERIFLHDWTNVARQNVDPTAPTGETLTRVTAYYMHEDEQAAAIQAMAAPLVTQAFAIGVVREHQIEDLRRAGLLVRDEPPVTQVLQAEQRRADATAAPTNSMAVAAFGPPPAAAASADEPIPAPVDYYVVRIRGPLLDEWRQALERSGVTLLERLGKRMYKARLSQNEVQGISTLDFVESVRWISPLTTPPQIFTRAAAPPIGRQPVNGWKMLTFDVRLHDPADRPKVEQWLEARNDASIAGTGTRKIRIYAREDAAAITELTLLPEVDTVAEYVEPELCNDAARRLLGVDAPAGHIPPNNVSQTGEGQIVGVADTGLDDTHPDFSGRIAALIGRGRAGDTSDPEGHGTHVAGSILGDGSASGGQIRGVAPKARLFFQSLLDASGRLGGLPVDLNELFDEAYAAGVRIHNNSWGAATPSQYTINAEEVDEFIHQHPDMLVVISAGNAGSAAASRKAQPGFVDWLSIGSPASCKNALTVGASRSDRTDGPYGAITWGQGWPLQFPAAPIAQERISGDPNCMAAFSSRGPCDDHRIKPDVVAPGTDILSTCSSIAPIRNYWGQHPGNPRYAFDGGTSMAAPLIAGCAALVRQFYIDERGHQPSAALLKATLINSTTWLSGADSVAPSNGRPNYHQGFGMVNMQRAIPNPSEPGLGLEFRDGWQTPTEAITRTGDRRRYQLHLGLDVPDLRVCMAYTDAPARGLQNNLDLVVQYVEGGKKWFGNSELPDALLIPDPDNNVEILRLAPARAGTYIIQVFAGNMLKPPQHFALVVSGVGIAPLVEI
ncbi:MAG: S8 family serine peptidase [Thermoanaerobaculia bacterium]